MDVGFSDFACVFGLLFGHVEVASLKHAWLWPVGVTRSDQFHTRDYWLAASMHRVVCTSLMSEFAALSLGSCHA
jgi:hypothetical protein